MQIFFIFIAFVLQFHNAFATPMDGWQLIDVVRAASIPDQSNGKGYECGNDFFSDSEIKEALSKYRQYMNLNPYSFLPYYTPQADSNVPQAHHISQEYVDFDLPPGHQNILQNFTPKLYQGLLYRDSGSTKYILWPIQKEDISHSTPKYYSDSYYIVVKENNGEVIDVISKIINNDLTKCIRIDGSRRELSTSAPDMNNGYQCAHEFLSDELLQQSLRLAWNTVGRSNLYPMQYVGRLYPGNSDYLIWPIFSRDGLYDYNSVVAGPYFLVIDILGNLIETVVQGHSNNFLRCTRSRISLKRPKSNVPNDLSVPAPDMQSKRPKYNVPSHLSVPALDMQSGKPTSNVPNHLSVPEPNIQYGYFCDLLFFSDKAVEEAAEAAMNAIKMTFQIRFPLKYNGPPFREPVLLWPLMTSGFVFERGTPGFHRVILTEDSKLMGVGMEQSSTIRLCKKGTKNEIKNHEKSDFFCLDHVVRNQDLQVAAKNGCNFSRAKKHRFYPAKYMGPNFEKSGPYLTFPVLAGKNFKHNPGPDRVVMNTNCEVVGAITYYPKPARRYRSNTFAMCVKLQDKTQSKTFILHDNPISEHRLKYSS